MILRFIGCLAEFVVAIYVLLLEFAAVVAFGAVMGSVGIAALCGPLLLLGFHWKSTLVEILAMLGGGVGFVFACNVADGHGGVQKDAVRGEGLTRPVKGK